MKPKKISENVTLYSSNPVVYVVSNFLSDKECEAFVELGKGKMERATVITDSDHEVHASRTNDYCWLEHSANDIVHEVSKRFSVLVQMPINNAEQFQLVYYGPGNEYKPHFDAFDKTTEEGQNNWFPGGQRMVTALAYLNDVKEGGETEFPEINVSDQSIRITLTPFFLTIFTLSIKAAVVPDCEIATTTSFFSNEFADIN